MCGVGKIVFVGRGDQLNRRCVGCYFEIVLYYSQAGQWSNDMGHRFV